MTTQWTSIALVCCLGVGCGEVTVRPFVEASDAGIDDGGNDAGDDKDGGGDEDGGENEDAGDHGGDGGNSGPGGNSGRG